MTGITQSPQVALQSIHADFDAQGFEAVKTDIQHLALNVPSSVVNIAAADRCDCPVTGSCVAYCVSDTATSGDNAGNYHTLSILKSGGSPGTPVSTSKGTQIAAYSELCLGTFPVSKGNFLRLQVAVTGGPSPTLTTANFAIRFVITPSATTAS